MVNATVNIEETERHPLKTLEGGFVVLKRLTYGQTIQRRSMMKMQVESKKGQGNFAGELALADEAFTNFDYKHCVVDHNLEDATGRKLNLANPNDLARLDPRVGQEIEELMGKMNDLESEDNELGNSTS